VRGVRSDRDRRQREHLPRGRPDRDAARLGRSSARGRGSRHRGSAKRRGAARGRAGRDPCARLERDDGLFSRSCCHGGHDRCAGMAQVA
jgi:hypothetical protein